jgi:hypothetical protein
VADIIARACDLPEVDEGVLRRQDPLSADDFTALFVGVLRAIAVSAHIMSWEFGGDIGAILNATFPQILENAAQDVRARIEAEGKARRACH